MRTLLVAGLLVAAACGGSSDSGSAAGDPFGTAPNTTVVVGPGTAPGNGTVVTTPSGDECVTLPNGVCVKPQKTCSSAERADVIVDAAGKVVGTICYPTTTTPLPTDGNVHGNNVSLLGSGPAQSIIPTNLTASGNNFAARGVTIKGNAAIDGNNATLVLCVVEGDVVVTGNNATVAGCTISGEIRIEGNNAVVVGNKVSKGINPGDHNATCDGNVDAAGAAITCASAKSRDRARQN